MTEFNLEQENKNLSFCLVELMIDGVWTPFGITQSKEGGLDFDSASLLSDELREVGAITCIVPTESWTFVTVDLRSHPVKISPFTEGYKSTEWIETEYQALLNAN